MQRNVVNGYFSAGLISLNDFRQSLNDCECYSVFEQKVVMWCLKEADGRTSSCHVTAFVLNHNVEASFFLKLMCIETIVW